jgi:type IV pilus assembly protein PilC
MLMTREIALLAKKSQRQWIKKPIRMLDKLQFFRQLSVLIDSGVLLPDALGIVGDQLNHPPFQECVHAIAVQVQEGVPFNAALEQYPQIFDQITIPLIRAGEESGRMIEALDAISRYSAATQDFYSRLRAALLLPAITLAFFLAILLIIFMLIMPRFIDIFSSMKQEIPPLTKRLLAISTFMRTPWMGIIVALGGLLGVITWRLTRIGRGRRLLDFLLCNLPLVGPIMQQRFIGYSMQALSVLLQGGMPLFQALGVVRASVQNTLFQEQLQALENQVAAGSSLSDAMIRQGEIGAPDLIAMIKVGQESGRLSMLLARVGHTYYERVSHQLSRLTMLLQPAVMIILGFLVALLIFAIYGPIFTMSSGF